MRFFEYGMAILGRVLTLEDAVVVRKNMRSTMAGFTGAWEPGFDGVCVLLLPGLLSKDKKIGAETRRLLELCLKGGEEADRGEELCKAGAYSLYSLRDTYVGAALVPFLSENGGQPPTVDAVSVCSGVKGGKLDGVMNQFLEGMDVETMYDVFAKWFMDSDGGELAMNTEVRGFASEASAKVESGRAERAQEKCAASC